MPFHVIKLDKELVWAMDNQRLAKPLVRNIIDFAGANHFQVTAEGVETITDGPKPGRNGLPLPSGVFNQQAAAL